MPKKDGITLIALIITIIVLVILAAVSISAVYNSNIIGFATNGAINYAEESKRENEILDHTASILESAISNLGSMNSGTSGSTEEPDEGDEEDITPPEIKNMTISWNGLTNATINVEATDDNSGIASYEFQVSTTSNTEGFTSLNTINTSNETCSYVYNLENPGAYFYFKVIVIDKKGNKSEKIVEDTLIGQYVDYTPVSGTFDDHVGETYSGDTSGTNQPISTDTSLKWQILFADSNKLTLISDKSVHNGFYLEGANGYNNGVLLLNNACKAMYSNSSLGATGRSLKIEDIESVSSYGGASNTEYSPSNRYYPNIFAQEAGGAPNGTYGSLGRSEQSSYVTGSSSGGISFKGRETWYSYTMSSSYMNQKYVTLFNCSPTSWLASRCVFYDSSSAGYGFGFSMVFVSGGSVIAYNLYGSDDYGWSTRYAVRPVVEIDLSKANVGATGDGGSDTSYSITAK